MKIMLHKYVCIVFTKLLVRSERVFRGTQSHKKVTHVPTCALAPCISSRTHSNVDTETYIHVFKAAKIFGATYTY